MRSALADHGAPVSPDPRLPGVHCRRRRTLERLPTAARPMAVQRSALSEGRTAKSRQASLLWCAGNTVSFRYAAKYGIVLLIQIPKRAVQNSAQHGLIQGVLTVCAFNPLANLVDHGLTVLTIRHHRVAVPLQLVRDKCTRES